MLKFKESEPELDKRLKQKKDEPMSLDNKILERKNVIFALDSLKQQIDKYMDRFPDKTDSQNEYSSL